MLNRQTYLDQLIRFKDQELIKVITGLRRCGKSSLLEIFAEYLLSIGIDKNNIIKINFEDLKYDNITYKELYDALKNKLDSSKEKIYFLFDEIQKVEKWELAINSLRLDKKADIYITGSNAYLLSSQLSTYLSGRYVEIKMLPLTFKEFLNFYTPKRKANKIDLFNKYLIYGGMPGLSAFNYRDDMINQILEGIFSTVLTKDIIAQSDIRDFALINKITKFLTDNIGNNISINKIKNTLVSQNTITKGTKQETIDNYITLLENAFIFYNAQRYDIKGKEYLKTQGKYYIADIGLRNYFIGYRDADRGHILENIVFLELLHRGYKVSIGKIDNVEIDFIATTPQQKIYIQVAETVLEETTRKRELKPLQSIRDNYEKIILTMDDIFTGFDENGIKIINLIDWLQG